MSYHERLDVLFFCFQWNILMVLSVSEHLALKNHYWMLRRIFNLLSVVFNNRIYF